MANLEYMLMNHSVQYRIGSIPLEMSIPGALDFRQKLAVIRTIAHRDNIHP